MDNWFLNSISLGRPESIKYIITAVNVEEENEDLEILKRLEGEISSLAHRVQIDQNAISKKQRDQDLTLMQIVKNQEKILSQLN